MKALIDAVSRVHACRTHADLVYLFEIHGARWRRQLTRSEHGTLVRHARERGRTLETIEGIGCDNPSPMGGVKVWSFRL